MPTENAVAPRRFPALDALRGVAALVVLFYHLRTLDAPGRPSAADLWFASGYLAVDLFFVLSGFVIAHAYGNRLRDNMGLRDFMIARFMRLQPVMAIGTLFGLLLALGQSLFDSDKAPGLFAIVTGLPANLLMLPNVVVPWGIFLFNPPAWSLFYELVANAIYAAGVTRMRRSSPRKTEIALLVWMGFGLVGLLLSVIIFGSLDRGVVLQDWFVALSRVSFSFALGVFLSGTRSYWLKRTPQVSNATLMIACVFVFLPDFSGNLRTSYELLFVIFFAPLLVMFGAATAPAPANRAAGDWLGAVSYPIYAIHAPIKHIVESIFEYKYAYSLSFSVILVMILSYQVVKFDKLVRDIIDNSRKITATNTHFKIPTIVQNS